MKTTRTSETDWRVLQHDAPQQLADNLWRVEGALDGMALRRCMVVVRLALNRVIPMFSRNDSTLTTTR